MIDSLYFLSWGGVKTILWITKEITKSFVIHYEKFERTHCLHHHTMLRMMSGVNAAVVFA